MWCTTFAFQPWHSTVEFKRYLIRFSHMVAGFDRLNGIMRTVYNQYDSMVLPLKKWLDERGVVFKFGARVADLDLTVRDGKTVVDRILFAQPGIEAIDVGVDDLVLLTLGSMTDASSLGSMGEAPQLLGKSDGGAWTLWERIAKGRQEFGRPAAFSGHIAESKWLSFTTTLRDDGFLRVVRDLTGNVPGKGGLITFPDSNWLVSIVVPHQPHFIGQPDDVDVFWGYGLHVDEPGNFVKKPMSACNGREIMIELLGHLHVESEAASILHSCVCIPCMMPFITSQFLRRGPGDRPLVLPTGTRNLAIIGQFCEMPNDVVFTVEYSVRSAQTAVYELLKLDRKPPAIYQGKFDPRVLFRAFLALHDVCPKLAEAAA